MNGYKISEVLPNIDPALLDYQEWVNVGFVMKDEGLTAEEWEDWSATDPRHHDGECLKKWRSFGSNSGVTMGTLVEYAKRQGWQGRENQSPDEGYALEWDAEIDDEKVIDQNWIEEKEIHEPSSAGWNQKGEIIRYLETLFDSTDKVGYVTETWEKDGKYLPTKGNFDRTAGELIQQLNKTDDITDVIGTINENAGAWIRFNPLDGKDVTNGNVTDYRYALVESDTMTLEKQYAMLVELNLPIKIIVNSGGKSLHAIVIIDAGSMEEYKKRVDYLYAVCSKNGFELDRANRNPSRLSRLPGVYRKGKKQFIVCGEIGCKTFEEWKEWIEAANDDLPDIDAVEDLESMLLPLDPPLIDGILRQGQKMLLAGPSKAGKSFAMIELCIAIAKGTKWFGYQCQKGKVLYVNLELERKSCIQRFYDVCNAMKQDTNFHGNLAIWNLRGQSAPMDKLAPKLIRRAMKQNYIAVIIDPIYKVLTGDENNAAEMSKFCAQFDRVCTELGTAVIYCHHHSKGAQGGKKSMDRASGSGVFARDPDALLDMIELDLSDTVKTTLEDNATIAAIGSVLSKYVPDWQEIIPYDEQYSRYRMEKAAADLLDVGTGERYTEMLNAIDEAKKAVKTKTAWRLEGTLREFPKPPALDCWFDYPVHKIDDTGILADMQAEAELPAWSRGARKTNTKKREKAEENHIKTQKAIEALTFDEPPTLKEVTEYLNAAESSVRRWISKAGYMVDKNTGKVIKKA